MTVATQIDKQIANGNGSATVFSFAPIVVPNSSWLKVYKRTTSNVRPVQLTEGGGGTQYTVDLNNSTVTYPSQGSLRLESGEKLAIVLRPPLNQLEDLENQEGYYPETIEAVFDKLTNISQSIQEQTDRSLKLPVDISTAINTTLPLPEAGKYLKWNDTGNAIEYGEGGGGDGGETPDPPPPPPISGTIQLDDGSAGAPSHSFSNATGTGMWRSDPTDALCFSVEGARVVSYNADGSIQFSTIGSGNPALWTKLVSGQNRHVEVTGAVSANYPSVYGRGASGSESGLNIGATPLSHHKVNFSGVAPWGLQVDMYGVEKNTATNQSPVVQALAEWLSLEYGGGTLVFPQGDYYFTTALNLPSNIKILGQGHVRFMVGKEGIIRTAGNYAFDDSYPNARLRSNTASGTNVWHIDTGHAGGVISRFDIGSKWRVRGAGGGDIEVRNRIDVTVASTDGVDDVTTVQNADVTYAVSWDPNIYPEAAAYEALYGETDYTYMDKFLMVLLLADAERATDQTITIPTDQALPFDEGDCYVLIDDQEEVDVAGTLKNRGNIEIVNIVKKTDLGSNITELTLAGPVSRTFRTSRGAAIYRIDWVENIHIENIDIVGYEVPNDAPASRVPMIEMRFVKNWSLRNVRYNGKAPDQAGRRGNIFRCYYSWNGVIDSCIGTYPGYTDSGEGYIFSVYNSRAIAVHNCTGIGGRHNFLTQVGTDIVFDSCFSYDCRISDFDCHGVNEVGITFSNLVIKQSELRSDGANTSVAGIRLGNTAHPLGCHDITISNINIFGNNSNEARGIDIVPPCTNINISGVKMVGVYDGIYARSNLAETLVAKVIRISNVRMDVVTRYGVALLGGADAGFTGYQLSDIAIDGLTVRGTNRPLIASEVDGLVLQNIDAKGVGTGTAQTAFDCDDILDLRASNIVGIDLYRGWALTDCPYAFIQFYWEGLNSNNILVDNGGSTAMEMAVYMKDGQSPGINNQGAGPSTDRIINTPGRQRGKVVTAATYTVLREDLGNTIIGNSSAGSGNTEFTINSSILRNVESSVVATQNIREMGVIHFLNINTDDMEILGGSDVTIQLPGGFTVLGQYKRATATIVRTGASTLTVYVTEG